VSYTTGVSLYTIRHFDEVSIKSLEKDKEVLLKQVMQNTVQIVTKA
jgi:aspartate kinase